jgi:hypothetical protein
MAGLPPEKRNELMHVLSHQMPEFSQVLLAGEKVSNNNLNYFFKRVSGKRDGSLARRVGSLWHKLTGPTEATFRYDLFLDRNPNFPILFQTDEFKSAFTQTYSQDGPGGILAHQTSPENFYFDFTRRYLLDLQDKVEKANPGASQETIRQEFMKLHSKYNSENERQFFNEVLNALTKPLPDVYVRALDAVTKGYYSKEQARRAGSAHGGSRRKTRRHRHRR